MPPQVIFGDIRGLDLDEIKPILQKHGIKRLDSAAIYMAGESERRLGEARMGDFFTIDTKVMIDSMPGDGSLEPDKVEESSKTSVERLNVNKINVLHAHAPDLTTSVEDQARGFNDAYLKGRFREVSATTLALSDHLHQAARSFELPTRNGPRLDQCC